MMDTDFKRVDEIKFHVLDIRNRGNLIMNNQMEDHVLTGNNLRVFPGGSLKVKRVKVKAKTLIIDVLGEVLADSMGYCSDEGMGNQFLLVGSKIMKNTCLQDIVNFFLFPGPGKGYTIGQYGTGGSYGGEGGAESPSYSASPAYGSFSHPADFGSGGGTGNGHKGIQFYSAHVLSYSLD